MFPTKIYSHGDENGDSSKKELWFFLYMSIYVFMSLKIALILTVESSF